MAAFFYYRAAEKKVIIVTGRFLCYCISVKRTDIQKLLKGFGVNIISTILFILSIVFILSLRDPGVSHVLRWIICIFCVSFFLRPLLDMKRLRFCDGGFALSFGLGTGISFLFLWFFTAVGLVRFNTVSAVICLIILTALVNFLSFRGVLSFKWSKPEAERFFLGFALFLVLFAAAFYVKGFKASLDSQTEQFMDFGFMQTMYRQEELAPLDLWFSGERLNYYYLGQAMAVYLCRLSFTTPEYGYNLVLCTILAALFMMVLSLTEAAVNCFSEDEKDNIRPWQRLAGALIGAMLAAFGANGHYLVYGLFLPFAERITGRELVKDFWFPDSTAFIGNYPEVDDKGKHEFPSYTMVLGDLHAHVCNMLFTIPLLALLLDYAAASSVPFRMSGDTEEKKAPGTENNSRGDSDFLRVLKELKKDSYRAELSRIRKKEAAYGNEDGEITAEVIKPYDPRELINTFIILTGALLGLFSGVNYWDLPIYFVIAGAVILFCDCKRYGLSIKTVLFVLAKGGVILIIENLIMLPFNTSFEKISSEIGICDRHTALWQLVLIWGFRFAACGSLLVYLIRNVMRKKRAGAMELSFIALISCAIGLIIMPELIYVKDIYGDTYQRYNTMFKLTYQGHILFSIATGIAVAVYLGKKKPLRIWGIVITVFGLLSSTYIITASHMWFGDVHDRSLRQGISAMDFMRRGDNDYSLEWGAIEYLNAVGDRHINIVEAGGTSYQPDCKLSVFTGANTVIGWYVHEWLWRNDPEIVGERTQEVRLFYEGGDREYCRDFIDRYKVQYIYVGPREYNYYAVLPEGFLEYADTVWADGAYMLLKVRDK